MNFFDRVQQLHSLLARRRTVLSAQDLMRELECSRATLMRLIAKLRDELGAPLLYDREAGGYRYTADAFQLPGLWLSEAELTALLTVEQVLSQAGPGLVGEALSPLRERVRALLGHPGVGVPEWSRRLRILSQGARPVGVAFGQVAGALARRERLRVRYRARSRGDAESEREISPQRLIRYRDNWYLDAWCHWREGLRSFSIDRIEVLESPAVAAKEIDDAQLDRELAAGYGILSGAETCWAELRFSAEAARWVSAEVWHPEQQAGWMSDGRYRLRVPYAQPEELLRDLLRHAGEVEVIAPLVLREALLQAHAAGLARQQPPVS